MEAVLVAALDVAAASLVATEEVAIGAAAEGEPELGVCATGVELVAGSSADNVANSWGIGASGPARDAYSSGVISNSYSLPSSS